MYCYLTTQEFGLLWVVGLGLVQVMLLDVVRQVLLVLEGPVAGLAGERLAVAVTLTSLWFAGRVRPALPLSMSSQGVIQ